MSLDKKVVLKSEVENYKRAMLILQGAYSDWAMCVTDEEEDFVNTKIRRAGAV